MSSRREFIALLGGAATWPLEVARTGAQGPAISTNVHKLVLKAWPNF
jgi:hypothetical protein